jgi:hypothetical protein
LQYGDPAKLKAKLTTSAQPLKHDAYVSVNEVGQFIRGQGLSGDLSKVTLGELRRQFHSNQDEMDALQAEVLRKREHEKLEEMKQLKFKSKEMALKRDLVRRCRPVA